MVALLLPDQMDHCGQEMFKLNTAILVLFHFLGQHILHVVHDVPGDVNLVGWQASVGYDPVYPDVPDVLHSNSVQSCYTVLGVIQLVLLCCFYPERADITIFLSHKSTRSTISQSPH